MTVAESTLSLCSCNFKKAKWRQYGSHIRSEVKCYGNQNIKNRSQVKMNGSFVCRVSIPLIIWSCQFIWFMRYLTVGGATRGLQTHTSSLISGQVLSTHLCRVWRSRGYLPEKLASWNNLNSFCIWYWHFFRLLRTSCLKQNTTNKLTLFLQYVVPSMGNYTARQKQCIFGSME